MRFILKHARNLTIPLKIVHPRVCIRNYPLDSLLSPELSLLLFSAAVFSCCQFQSQSLISNLKSFFGDFNNGQAF